MKYKIDFEGLKKHLESKVEKDFQRADGHRNHNPNAEIKSANAIDDIEHFKMDRSKIKFDTVINYGMPFLVDSLGNDLTIVQLTKRKFKNPNGRLMRAKHVKTIISDCRKIYGTPLNGYWVIPEQFISYS